MDKNEYSLGVALGLEPFDPQKHTPKDVGLGGPSTEYTITNMLNDEWANYPSIWWDSRGEPHLLNDSAATIAAQLYEARSGQKFPRYSNPYAAGEYAAHRSLMGGASNRKLTKVRGNY